MKTTHDHTFRVPGKVARLSRRIGIHVARGQFGAAHEILRAAERAGRSVDTTPLRDRPIADLRLKQRTHTAITGAGYETIGDLMRASDSQLCKIPWFGPKRVREVRHAIRHARGPNQPPPSRRAIDGPVVPCPVERQ